MTAEEIAAGLTKAQRSWITDRAELKKPRPWAEARWMTFPPGNTHRVLQRLGLVDGNGQILAPGLAVRAAIMKEKG